MTQSNSLSVSACLTKKTWNQNRAGDLAGQLHVIVRRSTASGMQAYAHACVIVPSKMYVYSVHTHVEMCAAYLARPGISRQPLTIDIHDPVSDGLQPGPICTCRSQHLLTHQTLHHFGGSSSAHARQSSALVQQLSGTRAAYALDMCAVRHHNHQLRLHVCLQAKHAQQALTETNSSLHQPRLGAYFTCLYLLPCLSH